MEGVRGHVESRVEKQIELCESANSSSSLPVFLNFPGLLQQSRDSPWEPHFSSLQCTECGCSRAHDNWLFVTLFIPEADAGHE